MPARSKSQQRLFGMVHAYQKGKLKNAPEQVKAIARSISDEDAEHFAKTKHNGLPEKKADNGESMEKCANWLSKMLLRMGKQRGHSLTLEEISDFITRNKGRLRRLAYANNTKRLNLQEAISEAERIRKRFDPKFTGVLRVSPRGHIGRKVLDEMGAKKEYARLINSMLKHEQGRHLSDILGRTTKDDFKFVPLTQFAKENGTSFIFKGSPSLGVSDRISRSASKFGSNQSQWWTSNPYVAVGYAGNGKPVQVLPARGRVRRLVHEKATPHISTDDPIEIRDANMAAKKGINILQDSAPAASRAADYELVMSSPEWRRNRANSNFVFGDFDLSRYQDGSFPVIHGLSDVGRIGRNDGFIVPSEKVQQMLKNPIGLTPSQLGVLKSKRFPSKKPLSDEGLKKHNGLPEKKAYERGFMDKLAEYAIACGPSTFSVKTAQLNVAKSLLRSEMSAARKAAIARKYNIELPAARPVSKTTVDLVEELRRHGLKRMSLEDILRNAPKDPIFRGSSRDYLALPEFQLFNQRVNSRARPGGKLGDLDIFHTANPFTALVYGPNGTFSVAPARRSRELRKGLTSFNSHYGPGGGGSSYVHPGRSVKRDPYTYGVESTGKPMRDFSRKVIRDKLERTHVTGYDMNYDQGYETALSRALEPELGARVYRKVPNGNIVAPPNTGGARTLSDVAAVYPGVSTEIYEDMAPIQRLIKRMYRNPGDSKFIEDSLVEFDPGFKKTFSRMRRRISENTPYGGGVFGSGYDVPTD